MEMFLRKPEYFLTVAREGSIVKAAKALYVSEPYLSQYITKLERENNTIFLDRTVSPFVLTEAGVALCRYIEKMQTLDKEMDVTLQRLQSQKRKTFNIGTSAGRGATLVPALIGTMMEEFPEVDIMLHEHPSDKLSELLADGICDVIFLHSQRYLPGVIYETLANEEVILCAPKDHPLVRDYDPSVPFDFSRLRNERFVLPRPEQSLTKIIYNIFMKYDIRPSYTVTTMSSNTTMKLVSQGFGFSFWTKVDAMHSRYMKDIFMLILKDPPLTFPLVAAYRSAVELPPYARRFIDLTLEYYKENRI